MNTYQFSQWDGTQQVFEPSEDDLMGEIADDLMNHGDVTRSLRNLFQRGMQRESGQRMQGLRDMLERLKARRQERLEQYNLDSVMDDLKERLNQITDTERQGIDRRLEEARQQQAQSSPEDVADRERLMQLLEERANRNKERLDNLPPSLGGAIKELTDYDFMDPEARQMFQELLDMLQQQMMRNFFQNMQQQIQQMGPEQMEGLKNLIEALNQMLNDRAMGLDPDFEGFMEQYGHFFDPDRPASLDELIERISQQMTAMQSLMQSMSPQMRAELESLMEPVIDSELMAEMAELAQSIYQTMPVDDLAQEYPFMGDESLTLEQAMELMGRLQDMDELERRLSQRMTESPDRLKLRLRTAAREMAEASKFDYRVVNHDGKLDEAVAEVRRIIELEIRRGRPEGDPS